MPLVPKTWILNQLLTPVLRPVTRLIIAIVAVPLLRAFRRRFTRWKELDLELEKDVEQWVRASLLLLFATKNVEMAIAEWFVGQNVEIELTQWWIAGGRLLLAIGVVESMPDQALFPLIHPGPPKLKWHKDRGLWGNIRLQAGPFLKGLLCQHLSRSSPVFAIMAAIFDQTAGWVFYFLAIGQYLIIGLVTSQDKALDALSQFDKQMERRRRELIEELDLDSGSLQRRMLLSRKKQPDMANADDSGAGSQYDSAPPAAVEASPRAATTSAGGATVIGTAAANPAATPAE